MGAVVFFHKAVVDCRDDGRARQIVFQVFVLEGRIYCEMDLVRGTDCCALLTPADAREVANALTAAAAFVEGIPGSK
jgi:hypothetical protein